jgi:hypothetical protein
MKTKHLISLAALVPVAVFAATVLVSAFDHGTSGGAEVPANHVVRPAGSNGSMFPAFASPGTN